MWYCFVPDAHSVVQTVSESQTHEILLIIVLFLHGHCKNTTNLLKTIYIYSPTFLDARSLKSSSLAPN